MYDAITTLPLLGQSEIDIQHQQLEAQILFLEELLVTTRTIDHDCVRDSWRLLSELTRTHFKFEEALMVKHNYPGYAIHVNQHAGLRQDLAIFMTSWFYSLRDLDFDLSKIHVSILKHWLYDHIDKSDRLLTTFLTSLP